MNIILDATGAGFGGLTYFVENLISEIVFAEEVTKVYLIGIRIENSSEKLHCISSNHARRPMRIISNAYSVFKLRSMVDSYLISISPSLSSLSWYKLPWIQNYNDVQFLSKYFTISLSKKIYRSLIYKICGHFSTHNVAISETTAYELVKHGILHQSPKVIYLSGAIERMHLNESIDLLIIGHSKHKNFRWVLRCIEEMRENISNVVCLVAPAFNELQDLKSDLKSDVKSGNIQFVSNLSNLQYTELINSAKVVVMNSEPGTEGFGLPLAQALFLNKNIVHSLDSALIEICGELGEVLLGKSIAEDSSKIFAAINKSTNGTVGWSLENRLWCDVATDYIKLLYLVKNS